MVIVLKYTIRSGDTLHTVVADLGKCGGITYQEIAQFNHIDPGQIYPGQALSIPDKQQQGTGFTYTVRTGDTLGHIASGIDAAAGITVDNIFSANPQVAADNLQIGQVIGFPSKANRLDNIGYWAPTWRSVPVPGDATMGIAFSGWVRPNQAISESKAVATAFQHNALISLGGGNVNGRYTQALLHEVDTALDNREFVFYQGLVFDIEEGDSGLTGAFQGVFAKAKQYGYQIIVSVSHSAPYGISDKRTLMEAILADSNVDIISPMLYSGGVASGNDYTPTSGVPWDLYADCKPTVMPSIQKAEWYEGAKQHFAGLGIPLAGYIVWTP